MAPNRLRTLGSEAAQVIFGPWPIRPVVVGVICFMVFQYASGVLATAQSDLLGGGLSAIPVNVVRAAAISVMFIVLPQLHRRFTGGKPIGRFGYLVIMLLTSMGVGTTRFFLDRETVDASAVLYVGFVLRAFITLTFVNSALGIADARLRREMREKDHALELVQSQRSAVLEAEEHARQSIASLLHDRVQAGLVAAMLQLRQLNRSLDTESAATLSSVIADLEAMRTRDVRAASRQLSPDLRNVTLSQALKVLAATYEPAMRVSIDLSAIDFEGIDPALTDGQQKPFRLGLYRIIEQALLNAAIHGHAENVTVLALQEGDGFVVSVRDDGIGLREGVSVPGSGSAIIDAWTASLGGTWSLQSANPGAVLTARFASAA